MWNIPNKQRLDRIPRLYETEEVPLADKLIYLHFFVAGCDWYIAEFDGRGTFFGFAILNNNLEMAEWGCVSFEELKSLKIHGCIEVDCELDKFWQVKKASAIEKIRQAMNLQHIDVQTRTAGERW